MNKELLETQYLKMKLSQREIARKNDISQTSVRYYLQKYHITKNKINKRIGNSKVCPCCNKFLDKDQFYYQSARKDRPGKQGSWCKTCMNNQVILRQRKYKQQAINYKGGKCQKCSYKTYAGALEFHHLDPSEKDFEMSKFSRNPLTEEAKLELDKCVLLCANCHREEHARIKGIQF